jgi:hypothetical protein
MPKIHFIDGEKGGVGKSLFARTMVQYCLDNNLPFRLVEADGSNPDVGDIYGEAYKQAYKQDCEQIVFTENEKKAFEADRIFNLATENQVIVNLPSQVYKAVNRWIDYNGLLDPQLVRDYKVEICKWFVSAGGYDSLQLFMQSATKFEGKVRHLLVRNLGLCDDWAAVAKTEGLQDVIDKYKVVQVDFPKLSYMERNLLDQKRIPFAEAMKRENVDFPILSKQRIANFLKDAYKAIEATKLLEQGEQQGKSRKKKSEQEQNQQPEQQGDQQPAA